MSKAQDQGEPSMEEILASIRKIISDDEDPTADGAAGEKDDPQTATPDGDGADADDEDDEDILELTQAVDADGKVVNLRRRQAPPEAEGVPDREAASGKPNAGLVSSAAETAAVAALSSMTKAVGKKAPGAASDKPASVTMEGLVRDALEPHLKAWLDGNLSDIVERVVREEVRRLVRRAEDS
jgi:cell pole-organizing protein PopZ